MSYQIFTDSTADYGESMGPVMQNVKIIPLGVEICGKSYNSGPDGDITPKEFYDLQRQGNYATTSQINPSLYFFFFEPELRRGRDILYLCFTSGLSGCWQSANMCIEELKKQYPERNIVVIDTLCASVGEAFLVYEAAKRQAEGYNIDDLAEWVLENRISVCHWFTVDVFDHLKHGGRVSAVSAAMGTLLGIKPMLHVNVEGKLEAVEKPRGKNNAMEAQLNRMRKGWEPEKGKLVVIGHGDNLPAALELKEKVLAEFPDAEIHIAEIGLVIGAHTGPGMLALIYWGDNR